MSKKQSNGFTRPQRRSPSLPRRFSPGWHGTLDRRGASVGAHLVTEGKSIKGTAICPLCLFLQAHCQPKLSTFTANCFKFAIIMWTHIARFYYPALLCEVICLLVLAKSHLRVPALMRVFRDQRKIYTRSSRNHRRLSQSKQTTAE